MHRQLSSIAHRADEEQGPTKTMPRSLTGRLVTPIHSLAQFGTPIVYFLGVALSGLEQPGWMQYIAFPTEVDEAVGIGGKAWLRTAASIGFMATTRFTAWCLRHLGAQWHWIGIREKPKSIVTTGPYQYVRHPIYSIILVQQLCLSGMFWSYVPLISFGVIAAAFAVKIPIEENLMEEDPFSGPAYQEYKNRVKARVIPYVW